MTADQLISIVVTIALIELMVAIGLGVRIAGVLAVVKNRRLLIQAFLANYVCVPAVTVGLLLLFHADPMIAAGFLIAAACPGAPFGPPFTALAKGNLADAVGVMVLLAGSSAVVAPLLLRLLLPFMTGDSSLSLNVSKMVLTLLAVQIVPLFAGLAMREWRPSLADKLLRPAKLLSLVLNLLAIGLILAVHFQTVLVVRPRAYVGMLALVAASLATGWLLGMPGSDRRKAMAITTAVRNVGLGLVIAASSFPDTPAVTATLVFGLFQTIAVALLSVGWGRRSSPIPAP
jgi:bile acid:Na+ symporter, BASS family